MRMLGSDYDSLVSLRVWGVFQREVVQVGMANCTGWNGQPYWLRC